MSLTENWASSRRGSNTPLWLRRESYQRAFGRPHVLVVICVELGQIFSRDLLLSGDDRKTVVVHFDLFRNGSGVLSRKERAEKKYHHYEHELSEHATSTIGRLKEVSHAEIRKTLKKLIVFYQP
jgi:hypothetical protein